MDHIIKDVQIRPSQNCLYGCFHNLLLNRGLDMDESEVFFCSKGLDIYYDPISHNLRLSSFQDMLEFFVKSINANAEITYDITGENVIKSLRSGEILVLFVDPMYLEYYQFFSNSENRAHFILMYGIESGKSIYVLDPYLVNEDGSINTYQGTIPLTNAQKAVRGIAHIKMKYAVEPNKHLIRQLISESIFRFINNKNNEGINAVLSYINDLRLFFHLTGNEFEQKMMEVVYTLKTGIFLCSYPYIQAFTNQYINRNLNTQIDKWNKLLGVMLQAGFSGRKNNLDQILNRAEDLLMDLRETMTKILRDI